MQRDPGNNHALFVLTVTLCWPAFGGDLDGAGDSPLVFIDRSDTHLPPVFNVQTKDVRPADIDGDGDLDLFLAHEYQPNVVLVNDGTGRFEDQSKERLPQLARDSEDIASADFDNDGDMDVFFANEDDQVNEMYWNNGQGHFSVSDSQFPVEGVSNAVAVADLNGDGIPDLVLGNGGQNNLLVSDGRGGFRDETPARLPSLEDATQDLEFADVDGDGDLDLLVANEDRNRLLINDGEGVFSDESDARLAFRAKPEETREVDLGDVDGDGDLDVYFANVNFRWTGDSEDRLLLNDGKGRFLETAELYLPAMRMYTMDADFVDIDSDGDADLLLAGLVIDGGLAPVRYRLLRNDGSGRFYDATHQFLPDSVAGVGTDIEVADFDGDGTLDLYLGNRAGRDLLLFGFGCAPN